MTIRAAYDKRFHTYSSFTSSTPALFGLTLTPLQYYFTSYATTTNTLYPSCLFLYYYLHISNMRMGSESKVNRYYHQSFRLMSFDSKWGAWYRVSYSHLHHVDMITHISYPSWCGIRLNVLIIVVE